MNTEQYDNILISIIIITRNEEKNIAACIESVLRACKTLEKTEVILVDSASSDSTIKIAAQYPIKIIQISPLSHLSASAGRHTGFMHAKGKFIQFVDGDMTLYDNWFECSLKYFNDEKIAGITGLTINSFDVNKNQNMEEEKNTKILKNHETNILFGAALYKYEVLKKIGGYNPYLFGNEEAELSFRIRRAGYKLLKLPEKMAIHHGRKIPLINEFMIRLQRKYYFGCGQTLRLSTGDFHLFLAHLLRFRTYLFFIFWMFLGMLFLINNYIYNSYNLLLIWSTGTFLVIIIKSIKKRSIKASLLSILSWSLFSTGIIIGFLIPTIKKEIKYKVLKDVK